MIRNTIIALAALMQRLGGLFWGIGTLAFIVGACLLQVAYP